MGKKKKQVQKRRSYLRAGVMGLLVVAGLGTMAGMAAFNGSARPNRDMQWYVREGAMQVAAPAMEDKADTVEADADAPAIMAQPELSPNTPAVSDDVEKAVEAPAEAPGADATDEPLIESTEELPFDPMEEPLFDEIDEPVYNATDAPAAESTAEPVEEDNSGTVTIKITAAGDCTFGGEMGAKGRRRFIDLVGKYGYDYFFNNVRYIFENDDLTIVNLEGPLTSVEKPGKHGGFIFKGDPEYVKILTGSSVELCNLANNHTLDYGKTGLKETAQVLSENGVGFCGFTQAYNTVIKGVRVCALGYTWWDIDFQDIIDAVAEARKTCDLLIVSMHWGWEGENDRDPKQAELGRAIIDAGADLVIGTHPHVYQGIERYHGRYIVYSLGNFCFAGNANPADKRCLIFQQTFSFNPGMGIAQANIMDAGINVIPCTVSSVTDKNDFQPTVMTADQGASLLKAVARHSTNFSLTDSLWMKDNYMLTYGLIKPKEEVVGPVTAEAGAGEAEETAGDGTEET